MSDPLPAQERLGLATGAMFFAGFGALWMAGWSMQWRQGIDPIVLTAVILCGVLIYLDGFAQYRRVLAAPAEAPTWSATEADAARQTFRRVNLVQWVGAVVLIVVLNFAGYAQWIEPGIILIVGAHFIPLARVFRSRRHLYTGAALIAVAVIYPFATAQGTTSPLGCLGAGLVLWISALFALARLRVH